MEVWVLLSFCEGFDEEDEGFVFELLEHVGGHVVGRKSLHGLGVGCLDRLQDVGVIRDDRSVVAGDLAPASEYDDANFYLENPRSGDRIWLGNSHDGQLGALAVPGIYDLVYESETVGAEMPMGFTFRTQPW